MIGMDEIRKLDIAERIQLIEAIWRSVEADTDMPMKDQEAELIRRIDLCEAGETKTYTWEEIKSRLKVK